MNFMCSDNTVLKMFNAEYKTNILGKCEEAELNSHLFLIFRSIF